MSAPARGIPFVLAAPSGTGTTTVCLALREQDPNLIFSVSHTTRPPRAGERDGVNYHFVSAPEFQRLRAAEAFLEWAVYNGNYYGTSWKAIEGPLAGGNDVLLEIEVQGARQVRSRLPDARLIFLLPPSKATLLRRLEGRATDTAEQVEGRLRTAQRELEAVEEFDYAVVNDDLALCVANLRGIIAAERAGETSELRRRFTPRAAAAGLRAEAI
ncbi:MAG: guanylate kinase [Candidatus Limnocylindria bacterium]